MSRGPEIKGSCSYGQAIQQGLHTEPDRVALDSMALTGHRGQFSTKRNWSWRQWSELTTLGKMDLEGLY